MQVMRKFCALQQPDRRFLFQELLKSACVLDDGMSTVCIRNPGCSTCMSTYREKCMASQCQHQPQAAYPVYKYAGQVGGHQADCMDGGERQKHVVVNTKKCTTNNSLLLKPLRWVSVKLMSLTRHAKSDMTSLSSHPTMSFFSSSPPCPL